MFNYQNIYYVGININYYVRLIFVFNVIKIMFSNQNIRQIGVNSLGSF